MTAPAGSVACRHLVTAWAQVCCRQGCRSASERWIAVHGYGRTDMDTQRPLASLYLQCERGRSHATRQAADGFAITVSAYSRAGCRSTPSNGRVWGVFLHSLPCIANGPSQGHISMGSQRPRYAGPSIPGRTASQDMLCNVVDGGLQCLLAQHAKLHEQPLPLGEGSIACMVRRLITTFFASGRLSAEKTPTRQQRSILLRTGRKPCQYTLQPLHLCPRSQAPACSIAVRA